jgi:hypothetical protein
VTVLAIRAVALALGPREDIGKNEVSACPSPYSRSHPDPLVLPSAPIPRRCVCVRVGVVFYLSQSMLLPILIIHSSPFTYYSYSSFMYLYIRPLGSGWFESGSGKSHGG